MNFRTRRRNARVLFACVVLLALAVAAIRQGSVTPASRTDPAPARLVNVRCADVVVLGLRGSGQSLIKYSGVGTEVLKSVQDMAARLHAGSDTTVRLEAVKYHAETAATLGEYQAGVADGRRRLGAQYERLSRDCQDSKVALVGFSQGAQVVHEFSHNLNAGQARSLVLVGMIADPRRNPEDTIAAWSYAPKPAPAPGRLGAGPRFSPDTRQKAITLCAATDEVCNRPDAGPPNAMSTTHKKFYEKASTVRSTGRQLTAILHSNGVG